MSQYVVLVESDFRSSNLNYRIRRSDTLSQVEAQALFDRVVRGDEPKMLKAKEDALLVRTADNQVCRFWSGITKNESMDRITLAPVLA